MPAIDLRFVATLPATSDLRFGNVWGSTPDYIDITLSATLASSAPAASLPVELDNSVSRGPKAWSRSSWQEAEQIDLQLDSQHRVPPHHESPVTSILVEAVMLKTDRSAGWKHLTDYTSGATSAPLQDGRSLAPIDIISWRVLFPKKLSQELPFGDAISLGDSVGAPWITLFKNRRPISVAGWEDAAHKARWIDQVFSVAAKSHVLDDIPWEEARLPSHGISPHPGGGTTPNQPCYVPGLPVDLRFKGLQPASLNLLFRCPNYIDPVGPAATIIVPVRRLYMQSNTTTLVLADSGQPIPVRGSLNLSLDADSWVWGWSASVPASYLSVLSAPLGDLIEVLATVNGTAFRLAVERISRDRQFGQAMLSISGRGRAAWLADPYADIVSRSNQSAMTAQQLMAEALTENGVSIGWAIDWQITDWLVPAGSWNHTGTAMDACLSIAEAAGAYIQAHRTDQVLSVLPRYPAAPWNWQGLTPDIQLPEDVCVTEGIEWVDKPAYNTVFISGQGGGILAHVTRQGSAGDKPSPMVTDALITHADAGAQRGTRILSDTGRQKLITLSLPVLAETGIIVPGKLVRYSENGVQHVGLTRAVGVNAEFPKTRQSIKIESHVL